MDMKKFFGLMVAAVLGGSITYALLNRNDGADIAQYQQGDSTGRAVRPMQVNYSGMVDFRAAASSTVDAVVHVKIRSQQTAYENPIYNFLFGKPSYQEQMPIVASGSGVIISRDGYIVTNNHVIEGADALEVTLDDKRTFAAKVIGADPTTDIALIKIEGDNFPFIPWGDSDKLQVGEWVLAIGNPFNLASTVTAGIVSAKARSINIINKSSAIEAFIQTDAAVNPGNSGGALVNIEGQLVGIITAIASPTGTFSGYSFAVPERIAKKTVSDLMEFGTVQRAFIGISISDVTSDMAQQNKISILKGVYVNAVTNGGAAQDAGIKAGDVILKVNGVEVNKVSELQEQIGQYRPGQQVNITIMRNNKTQNIMLTLRNIEGGTSLQKAGETTELLGASIRTVTPQTASSLRLKGGVEIVALSDGKFAQAGVKQGFIITSVNRKPIYSADDLRLILQNTTGGIYLEGVYPNGSISYYAFGI
ncbi:MAG: Do family serine endopeptidase [Salinivirgaceae bacterium]|nr:Do family serine endopeptidase [Salinivirgaceae bacterium]